LKQQVYSAFDIVLTCGICDRTIHTSVNEYMKSTRIRGQLKATLQSRLDRLKGVRNTKDVDYNQMRKDLRDRIKTKCFNVNFHYECATEHDELMTADEYSDMGDNYDY